jgi:membrane protein implicated in regulation of membrane protease activity
MSNMEGMDIRAPIGGLFTVLGVMLAGYGLVAPAGGGLAGSPSTTNVNLWWGLTMLVFGVIMLVMSRRAVARSTPTE